MLHEPLPDDLLRHVTPQHVRSYAIAKGWRRVQGVNGHIALFDRPSSDQLEQLIVPMEPTLDDYDRRIRDIVEILSDVEARSGVEILNDLLMPDADIVRFRVVSPVTEKATVPLLEGIRLLDGARKSLLAAACSVVNPSVHHPRMSRLEAQQLLSACQLGQTERGSFTLAIACPLRAVEQDQLVLPGIDPFTRQTTLLLIRSVHRLVSAIEADNVAQVYESHSDQPVLSTNLCDALLEMQPPEERSALILSVSWASVLPGPARETVPQSVRIRSEHFPIIEDVYKQLRPEASPHESVFVGMVDTLNGQLDSEGRMQGETVFSVVVEDDIVKARADLSPDDYQKAVEAHRVADIVTFSGILHAGRRVHRITNIRDLEVIPRRPTSDSQQSTSAQP